MYVRIIKNKELKFDDERAKIISASIENREWEFISTSPYKHSVNTIAKKMP